ncbi:MAG: transglutaminase family protein [Pseudohongiella sp.]|nr:transglutaminase family protein [Pseudohongiella sp.]
MVRLKFSITLNYQVLDASADFILNFQPAFTERQKVLNEELQINQDNAAVTQLTRADGIRYIKLRAGTGPLSIFYSGTVDIDHYQEDPDSLHEMQISELPIDVMPFVYPSRYCQSDELTALANFEFGAMKPGYHRVVAIQQWVNRRIKFQIGSSGSTTTARDTLLGHAGVCRDFAHLMIALCRALNMPARFVSGIDYGADPSLGPTDFHAYVEVMLSGRWYLFDPSDVSPTMGLVRLGTGRDAADVSFATVFGNVLTQSPVIEIQAVVDEQNGFYLPVRQQNALSSSDNFVSTFNASYGK